VPEGALPDGMADSLQSVLNESVSNHTIGGGVAAGVILAGSGSWSGASGVDVDGERLTPGSQLIVASIGKTVTAAQVMRLVEEGRLDLLDPITDHLPPEAVLAFDANGATIQDLLGMRSGLQDPLGYRDSSTRDSHRSSCWRGCPARPIPLGRRSATST
jgi:CubicO group peptidase (beta-lactamase class C family)